MPEKALRKDAASRRATILVAAEEAFARKGLDVPLDEICVAAGVGRATLYRNFENRTALVLALMTSNSNKLELLVASLGERPDGLRLYLAEVLNQLVKTGGLVYLIGTDPRLDSELTTRFTDHLRDLIARAAAAGLIRPDANAEMVRLVVQMMWGGLDRKSYEQRRAIAPAIFALGLSALGMPATDMPTPSPGA